MIWPTCQSKDLHSFLKARVVKRCEISCNFINPKSPKSIDFNKFGATSFPHLQQRNTSSKLRFKLSVTRLLGARKRLLLCTAHSMNHPKSYDAASAMVSLRLDTLLKKGLNCESYFWGCIKAQNKPSNTITHPKETIGVALPLASHSVSNSLRLKSTGM